MTTTPVGPWVEKWLSEPRFDRYLKECDGDRRRALDTYEWNCRLAQAVIRDTGHFEVALRNAYDRAISARWSGSAHWLLDPASPVIAPLWKTVRGQRLDVNTPNRRSIADAARKNGGSSANPNAVLAELTFGFWEHLADAAHEQTVWIPYIYYAWPKGTARAPIERATHLIAGLRNKAAHNEPLFAATGHRSIVNVHAELVRLVSMHNPGLADHLQQTSTVKTTMAQRP